MKKEERDGFTLNSKKLCLIYGSLVLLNDTCGKKNEDCVRMLRHPLLMCDERDKNTVGSGKQDALIVVVMAWQ
jgi:hypothetical protein